MGKAEHTVAESAHSDELDQPFGAEKLQLDGGLNPFPEAVVVDPVIVGRRKSHTQTGQNGTFETDSLDSYYQVSVF